MKFLIFQPRPNTRLFCNAGVNCMYEDPKLIVFFYVDNIVVLAKPGHLKDLEDFEKKLLKRYQIRALGNLEFFCGIRVIRDREEGQIRLCQDSYIDKLREKFQPPKGWSTKPITTPLPLEELVPAEKHTANPATSLRYSQIVRLDRLYSKCYSSRCSKSSL